MTAPISNEPTTTRLHHYAGRYFVETLFNRITCNFSGGLGPTALAISHAIPSRVFHGLKFNRWNSADSNVLWGCAVVELHAELREFPCPWLSLLLRGIALLG